eukprot:m.441437 g.441437  ORF g.441437 m.441437 type:complete len:399 (-) comp18661_c0_seq1:167-1363(-)
MSYPPVEAVAAVVRQVGDEKEFDPRDFELVLTRRPTAGEPDASTKYELLTSVLRVGEPSRVAAERACFVGSRLNPARSFRVTTATHPRRCRDQQKIAVLYVVAPSTPEFPPQDVGLNRTSYFNMGDVIESEDVYPMVDDHRELLYSVVGWVRQAFSTNQLSLLEPVHQRKIKMKVVNMSVEKGLRLTLDNPPIVFTNQHFLSGNKIADDSGRTGSKKVTGLSDLDINVENNAASDEARHESVTDAHRRTIRHDPRTALYAAPAKVRGSAAAIAPQEDAAYAALGSPQSEALELPVTHHAEHGPTGSRKSNSRSTNDALPPPPPPPMSYHSAPPQPVPTDYDGSFGFHVDEEVDEVSAALAGLRREKEGSRRSAVDVDDSDHPFLDDLNGDFTNPLAVH